MRLQPGIHAGDLARPTFHPRSLRLAYLMMLASSLSFTIMSACSHAAGERCDWRFPALARAGLVFAFSALLARVRGVPLVWRGSKTLWARSLTGSVSMLMAFYALTHLSVATAITLSNTFPLWVTVLAWPILRQRPTLGVLFAVVSGVAGVCLIEQPQHGDFRLASIFALASALCSALVMIGLHRLRHYDPLQIVVHFSGVATVFIGAFVLWTDVRDHGMDFHALVDPVTLPLLLGIGLFGTLGQVLMTTAFRVAQPQRLSVIGLSQVFFALGFDVMAWHRGFDWAQLTGIALVLAPVGWLLARRGRGM